MTISSPAFASGESIPKKYTCDGENINPQLFISDVPDDAVSLALVMNDPDAPNGVFTHWTIWNIDPTTTEIPEGSVPQDATCGKTSFGSVGYGGPCPPSGSHRYFFKLYALDTALDLPEEAEADELEEAIESHIVAETQIMGRFGRTE